MDETLEQRYKRYNLTELEQVLRDTNKENYPERALIVEKEISKRLGFITFEEYKDFTKYGFRAVINESEIKTL